MIRSALLVGVMVYAALAAVCLRECAFLAPLWRLIWDQNGVWLLWFSAVLVLNISAGAYALMRRLALKNTGDKLAHLEKQLRSGETISEELSEQILEHRK